MKISRIILKGVNNFEDFDYSFEDEWTETILDSLVLMGPNGSGKTTILRAIVDLWRLFGSFLERNFIAEDSSIFSGCQLAAVGINEFLPESGEPLWIYFGNDTEVEQFLHTFRNNHRVGGSWSAGETMPNIIGIQYLFPGELEAAPEQPWLDILRDQFTKNRLGGLDDLPNIVFLESEQRYLHNIVEGNSSVIPEKETFNWLAQYTATSRREGSIENYLFTLKAVKPEVYDQIVAEVNKFLADKQISRFDEKSRRLLVTTNSGQSHPIHLLSSGEKQVLLMIAFITREFRSGGIVLIDEPDLHLHVSLRNAFITHLKQMVVERKGQLIIASHDPEIWNRFIYAQQINLGPLTKVPA